MVTNRDQDFVLSVGMTYWLSGISDKIIYRHFQISDVVSQTRIIAIMQLGSFNFDKFHLVWICMKTHKSLIPPSFYPFYI